MFILKLIGIGALLLTIISLLLVIAFSIAISVGILITDKN